MKNTKIAAIKFVQSLVFLPFLSGMVPVGMAVNETTPFLPTVAFVSNQAEDEAQVALRNQEKLLDEQGAKIDAYFESHDAPLKGYGRKMAEVALENEIDYRLLPAIAMRESTGGIHQCKKVANSPFGWGSCKIGFDTMDESIETVGRNLGGNNPNTERYYKDKPLRTMLQRYNPPHIVERYADQVMEIMKEISPEPLPA